MERELLISLGSSDRMGGKGSKLVQKRFRNRVPTEVMDTPCLTPCLKKNYVDDGLNKRF